jgi:large subunit ribosomal protein L25
MRRLRKTGKIPAVLYGHGEGTVSLTVNQKEIDKIVGHGGHIVELKGAVSEGALIKEVQWDAFGSSILHVDLTRIDPNEKVEVTLPLELKGDAPGTHNGGVVQHVLHELTIVCPANKVVDSLTLKINDLELDQTLTAGDVELPDGATLAGEATEVVASCSVPSAAPTPDSDEAAAEPEVIGEKKEESGDE